LESIMRHLILVYFVLCASGAAAATLAPQTVASIGDGKARSWAVASGADGDILLGLELTASAAPDSDENAGIALAAGQSAAAVAAYSTSGRLRWARALTSVSYAPTLHGLSAAADGSSCIVGSYSGSAAVAGATLPVVHAAGASDAYALRLSADGTPRWLVSFGGAGADSAEATLATADGGCFVAGSFRDAARFGDKSLQAHGGADAYVLRLNASGAVVWATALGGKGEDSAVALASAPAGGAYVLMRYSQPLRVDTREGSHDFSVAGAEDALLLHFNADGQVQAAQRIGSDKPDHFTTLAADASGIAVVGYYSGSEELHIGAQSLALRSAGGTDGLMLRLDADLNLQDHASFGGGDGMLLPLAATYAADGRLWVAGSITGNVQIGEQTLRANRTDGVLLGLQADPRAAPRVLVFGGDRGQQLSAVTTTREGVYASGVTSDVHKSDAEHEAEEQREHTARSKAPDASAEHARTERADEEARETARSRSQAVLVRYRWH
jgi:hypothetical protein